MRLKTVLTGHAERRLQQRGLSKFQIDLIADWGIEVPVGRGSGVQACTALQLDRRGLRRVAAYLGKDGGPLVDAMRGTRLVMAGGKVVSVMHRHKRLREKNRSWRIAA